MTRDATLRSFPPALARLVLLGAGELPAAWGPMKGDGTEVVWDPRRGVVLSRLGERDPLQDMGRWDWSLPLDASSPWPARLATVAAWMLQPTLPVRVARLRAPDKHYEHYQLWASYLSDSTVWRYEWRLNGKGDAAILRGATEDRQPSLDLSTLPQWHALHPPEVALLLALYDVDEIRGRVVSAASLTSEPDRLPR